jgi:SpoIID/LytB domain protein
VLRRVLVLTALAAVGSAGAATSLLAAGSARTVAAPDLPPGSGPAAGTAAPTTTGATGATSTGSTTATTATTTATTTTATPVTPPAPLTTSTAPTTLVFTGHGWGHGIGMSQWGAYGYALHGWTYDQILAHYYTGTTLGKSPVDTVRVLLLEGAKRVALAASVPWRLTDAAGTIVKLPAGTLVLGASLEVNGQALAPPLTFTAKAPLELGKSPYRGRLVVARTGRRLEVVNVLSVESYLKGVVPSEVPSNWPAEALKAQAVAARSYALANVTRVVAASNFDLYADQRSQVYGGVAAEAPATSAAVDATAGQVVLYDGSVATTYFSSSSGGRTVSAEEATGKPVPYLVSVPDPYDTYSPNHDWGPVLFDAAQVATALAVPGLSELQTVVGPSQHVRTVTALGSSGSPVVLTGNTIRTDLGLRSTWFDVGWLSLSPSPSPIGFGGAVTLSGVVSGVAGVSLEGRPAGGKWQPVAGLPSVLSGSFSVVVRPDVTTQYRLTAGSLHAGVARVRVTPLVQATAGAGSVAGTVKPALAGAPVQLQLEDGGAWKTVATATTDSAGSFALGAALAPGSYRVRSAPGHGLSPGVSVPLPVQ